MSHLPATAQAAWSDLRDELRSVLGDNLVAMWAHGGMTFASFVRDHLPPTTARPPDSLPRWSGY